MDKKTTDQLTHCFNQCCGFQEGFQTTKAIFYSDQLSLLYLLANMKSVIVTCVRVCFHFFTDNMNNVKLVEKNVWLIDMTKIKLKIPHIYWLVFVLLGPVLL